MMNSRISTSGRGPDERRPSDEASATERRIAWLIASFAVGLVLLCLAVGGAEVAVGAAIGGLLAWLDFAFIRWAGRRVLRSTAAGQGLLVVLMSMKLGALGVLLYFLITVLGVHPGGLAIGLGALFLGVVVGSFGGQRGSRANISTPSRLGGEA